MKFIMIDKGYEYESDDKRFRLVKRWQRVRTHSNSHITIDKYEDVSYWMVIDTKIQKSIKSFHLLKDAKAYCASL